ncbi:hypothetical protein PIB30_000858 [Stylosanthes scabra]|uniref:RRM domain-containing protein n=1 Tax=Stylosanthes scabra TaxID=79078 RepID=A0ABU6R1J9_9FABA|nr:hypothetical protein [Stylosanthes scabra]
MASSQHRCVFVGNIPYDATEEQLIEICQEVGPVVSFRLVIDRETGKPKGYGFCEYKDEETALSARRNLQGYEINGRQLRVDFAENDKGNDRNREQGRGGPGLSANVDPQKQVGSSSVVHGDAAHHQPIGLHIAITAASVMTAALGGAQFGIQSAQNGLQSQSSLAHDPLTLHLAKMSRNQLNEIISEVKGMATQNKDMARQLLLSRPQLPKALFQAQIMLGMVTSQVLQMPNLRMISDQPSQPSVNEGQLGQPALVQTLSGPPQSLGQSTLTPYVQEGQASVMPHNPLVPNQLNTHPRPLLQPRMPLQQHSINHVGQLGTLSGQSNLMPPSARPQSLGGLSVRPSVQPSTSTASNQQRHAPLPPHSALVGSSTVGHNIQMVRPDASFQPGPSVSSGIPHLISKEGDRSAYSNIPLGVEKTNMVHGLSESFGRPSKLMKLDEGRSMPFPLADVPVTNGSSHILGSNSLASLAAPKTEVRYPEQQSAQLPADVESALLQQVLNLTPEQLSSLPPEQQQQVIQLQQALRRDQMQPS